LYWAVQTWNLGQPSPGIVPMRGSIDVIYNIQLVRVELVISEDRKSWDWDGQHCVKTSHTPLTRVGYIIVLIDTDEKEYCYALFCFECV
jgi:hypothetical protein